MSAPIVAYVVIEAHGITGDRRTAALVAAAGTFVRCLSALTCTGMAALNRFTREPDGLSEPAWGDDEGSFSPCTFWLATSRAKAGQPERAEAIRRRRAARWVAIFTLGLAVSMHAWAATPKPALRLPDVEGATHGFPVLRDAQGGKLADGEFIQWVENGSIQIRQSYDFGAGHRIEESAEFRQQPSFAQEEWSWREVIGDTLQRKFHVDFSTRIATAQKRDEDEVKRWSEDLEFEPDHTFAGIGFTLAIKSLRKRLKNGEKIELQAMAFTPKPRAVSVEISHEGLDEMTMAGRKVTGDRFLIRAKIPGIVRWVMDASDTRLWLIHPPPAGFLRSEGPLAEPSDPVIRIDLLPGDPSGPATPR